MLQAKLQVRESVNYVSVNGNRNRDDVRPYVHLQEKEQVYRRQLRSAKCFEVSPVI
jgi:hypothetical protein